MYPSSSSTKRRKTSPTKESTGTIPKDETKMHSSQERELLSESTKSDSATKERELLSEEPRSSPGETPLTLSLCELETIHKPRLSDHSKRIQYLFKVLVIGEVAAGKTSVIKTYMFNYFSRRYRSTIGMDIVQKVLDWDGCTCVRLQFWDIAGEERAGMMTTAYFRGASGAAIVYDVSTQNPFFTVEGWKKELDSKVFLPDGNPIPCLLLANKCDLLTKPIDEKKMQKYCREHGFFQWFGISAKQNLNLNAAFEALASKMIEIKDNKELYPEPEKESSAVTLQNSGRRSNRRCGCL